MRKVFLLASSSYHMLNDKINTIIGDNTNITTFSLNDVTISDVIEDASYFGLFNDDRVIIVKDTKYFGNKFLYEDDMDLIYKFVSSMDEKITLIFICDSITPKKANTEKMVELGAIIHNDVEIKSTDYERIIKEYIDESGYVVDQDALNLINNNCLNNLDTAILEIEKLSNIDKHITLEIVDVYGIKLDKLDEYAFGNAVVAKKFNEAFDELDKLLAEGVETVMIIGGLASTYSQMYMVRDAMMRGFSDEDIMKKIGVSSGRLYMIKKNSKIYTMEDLKNIIIELSKLDIRIKLGSNPKYTIKEFILGL